MPKELEDKLKREAAKKGLTGDRLGRYVYGTLAKFKKKRTGRDAGDALAGRGKNG